MTPLDIHIVLDLHCSPAHPKASNAPCYMQNLKGLHDLGLIRPCIENESGWATTEKGEALVRMWCSTPMPIERSIWADPREAS